MGQTLPIELLSFSYFVVVMHRTMSSTYAPCIFFGVLRVDVESWIQKKYMAIDTCLFSFSVLCRDEPRTNVGIYPRVTCPRTTPCIPVGTTYTNSLPSCHRHHATPVAQTAADANRLATCWAYAPLPPRVPRWTVVAQPDFYVVCIIAWENSNFV